MLQSLLFLYKKLLTIERFFFFKTHTFFPLLLFLFNTKNLLTKKTTFIFFRSKTILVFFLRCTVCPYFFLHTRSNSIPFVLERKKIKVSHVIHISSNYYFFQNFNFSNFVLSTTFLRPNYQFWLLSKK
jgi:hypothetical protein